MSNIEIQFHSWLCSAIVGVFIIILGILIPWLQALPSWGKFATIAGAVFLSHIGYRLVVALALWATRKLPFVAKWILGANYIRGFWVGHVTSSSGNTSIAIEKYDQDLSVLHIKGESYWPDGKPAATWETTSASINPETSIIYATYKTTIFDDNGDIERTAQGFGELRIDGNNLTGWVNDTPLKVKSSSGDRWEAKTFHYNLERIGNGSLVCFNNVRDTERWKTLRASLTNKPA